jgi:hypothetical protein
MNLFSTLNPNPNELESVARVVYRSAERSSELTPKTHDEVPTKMPTTPVLDYDRGRDRCYIFLLKMSKYY